MSSAKWNVAKTVGTAIITTSIIGIIVHTASNVLFPSTYSGVMTGSSFFLRKRIRTIVNKIITMIKPPVIITVVKMIKSIDISAPYPFGTNAVRLSLPHADSINITEPNNNAVLNFPIQPFMYAYLSFSFDTTISLIKEFIQLRFLFIYCVMYKFRQEISLLKRIMFTHFIIVL